MIFASGNATTPLQPNMLAGRRCFSYWALKSPAPISLRGGRKGSMTGVRELPEAAFNSDQHIDQSANRDGDPDQREQPTIVQCNCP